jgi:hypothetical protein
MTDTPPAPDADLANLVVEGRFQFLHLARCLLDADALVAGWSAEAMHNANAVRARGGQVLLEIRADERGGVAVLLVGLVDGQRHVLDQVADGSTGNVA